VKTPDRIAKENESKWDSQAAGYDKTYGSLRRGQYNLVERLELDERPRFLDIACGTGWAVRFAADKTNGRGEFYGVDISRKMIEQAGANLAGYNNVRFLRSGAESLPFANDFFDVVICTGAFHHFPEPAKAIEEACRVLKPGGRLYVMDGTRDDFLVKLLDWFAKKTEPEHVRMYSTREFRTFFQNAGLTYLKNEPIVWLARAHIGEKL
jgi:ubiquinone/menaquinone biosynthesis C-methylase UbiE